MPKPCDVPQYPPDKSRPATRSDHLIRIADRLGSVKAGSLLADITIHNALGLVGPVQPYTTNEAAALSLLPADFEWLDPVYSSGVVYIGCRRAGLDGRWPRPHYGHWGNTSALAACGAALRAYAKIEMA